MKVTRFINKIYKIGFLKTFKLIKDKSVKGFIPTYYKLKWNRCKNKKDYIGVSRVKRDTPLIVSLTTYPARINTIHLVIQTLLMQSLKPNIMILWLANEQFPNKKLPNELIILQKYGLQIKWCSDIKSYKKLIPTLLIYPQAVIITVDDDVYYHSKMIERLYNSYCSDPTCIHCHRATKIIMKNNEFKAIGGGYDIYPHSSFLHKLTGVSGVCYPPNALFKDITKEELFMLLAPTNDDIWFWLMAVLNGKRCNVVNHSCTALYYIKNTQNESLSLINDNGDKLFWQQLQNMFNYYPQLKTILLDEWQKENHN